jgi:hypothetical protein
MPYMMLSSALSSNEDLLCRKHQTEPAAAVGGAAVYQALPHAVNLNTAAAAAADSQS